MTGRQESPQDHYAVLGVEPTASALQITAAFRKLVRALHPDTNPSQSETDARLTDVVNAYAALHDPVRRAAYDTDRNHSAPTKLRGQPIPVKVRRPRAPKAADRPVNAAVQGIPPRVRTVWVRAPYSVPVPGGSDASRVWDLLWQWAARW
ncbi:J domain-containing protein [Streptomyces mirabilis]|uniref:J domain-containing protein n=1 Tax=Streptomyces mirabilis TaxID=68239 RepID=UPI0036AAB450